MSETKKEQPRPRTFEPIEDYEIEKLAVMLEDERVVNALLRLGFMRVTSLTPGSYVQPPAPQPAVQPVPQGTAGNPPPPSQPSTAKES